MSTSVPRTDQLLSAYLDGELNADEVREVEAWLAEDPAARQLLEELQAVSAAVQSLPVEVLEGDLSKEVLERLPATARPTRGQGGAGSGALLPERRGFRLSARGIRWSAAAIAAAIMLMVLQEPDDPHDGNVAKQEAGTARPPAAASPRGAGEMRAAEPQVAIALEDSDTMADGPAPEALSTMSAASGTGDSVEGFGSTADAPQPTPPGAGLAATSGADPAPTTLGAAPPPPQPTADTLQAPPEEQEERYLIVWVDMPEVALERRAIDKLLAESGIQIDPQREAWTAAGEPLREQIASRAGPAAPTPLARTYRQSTSDLREDPSPEQEAAPGIAAEGGRAVAVEQPQEPGQAGDAILVDATLEQVANTLAAMEEDAANFSSITVEPVAEPHHRGGARRALGGEESRGDWNRARRITSTDPLVKAAPPSPVESPAARSVDNYRLNIIDPLAEQQGEPSRALVPSDDPTSASGSRAAQVAEALTENTSRVDRSYLYSSKSLPRKALAAGQRLQVLFVLRSSADGVESVEPPGGVEPASEPAAAPSSPSNG